MIRILAAFVFLALPVHAGPAEDAARAAEALKAAQQKLATVEGRRNRVRALTEAISAVEEGMAAMRVGLRQAAIRERTLRTRLQQQEAEITQLLSTLIMINRAPEPAYMLHPMGPTGTARSAMIMAELTPALNTKTEALKIDIQEARFLADLQEDAQATLANALSDLQEARLNLSEAISNRTEIPRRFTEDPTKTAILLASTDTLEAFAKGLGEIVLNDIPIPLPGALELKGNAPLPTFGQIVRRFQERDAAGVARPGLVMSTEPGALVTTPFSATVRYQGALLDYGQVIILEPAADTLLVLGGLGQIFAKTGEVVIEGAPIGLMPAADGGGAGAQDTLYIEIRENQVPVDPATWFQL